MALASRVLVSEYVRVLRWCHITLSHCALDACHCHAAAMLLLCHCYAAAMLLPCCHAAAVHHCYASLLRHCRPPHHRPCYAAAGRPTIVIFDRGVLDSRAFLPEHLWGRGVQALNKELTGCRRVHV